MNAAVAEQRRPCPWQEQSWHHLQSAHASGRLAHAVLLTGLPGSGRRIFAEAAARYLLCESPQSAGNCGTCKSCSLLAHGAHADLFTLAPAAEGKRIGVDSVRELLGFMATTSVLGAHKLILVTALEAFTTNAFNAFLKGLEEPADNTFILLVAARGQYLPATIRSRCQRLTLPEPDRRQGEDWLTQAFAGGDEFAERASSLLAYMPGQPFAVRELAAAALGQPLLNLHEALSVPSGEASAQHLAKLAAPLTEDMLLSILQQHLEALSESAARRGDRSRLQRGLQARDRIGELLSALRSGCNPSADLLRSAAISAWLSVGTATGGAKLPPKISTDQE